MSENKVCNCKRDIEQRLTARFTAQKPDATDLRVSLNGYTFPISDDLVLMPARPAMPVEVRYKASKKSGGTKDVKESLSMVASFCPFCGEDLRPAATDAAA